MQDLTDFLAEEAAKIFASAGQSRLEVRTSCTRRRDGSKYYEVVAYDPDASRNPLNLSCAYGIGEELMDVLAQVAAKLDVAYPFSVEYVTGEQKQEIIRLLNDPRISRPEKTRVLLSINRMTTATAADAITGLQAAINERAARPVFNEAAYAVVGEAYLVAQA